MKIKENRTINEAVEYFEKNGLNRDYYNLNVEVKECYACALKWKLKHISSSEWFNYSLYDIAIKLIKEEI